MKTIASLPVLPLLLSLLCVALFAVARSSGVLYLRTPALDRAEVHTERIGGSFAYQTSELLAYSPIVYSYNVHCLLPLTINYQHPLSVLLARPGVPAADVDVTAESQPESAAPAPATDELIHDSVVTLHDDDTVAVDAATK